MMKSSAGRGWAWVLWVSLAAAVSGCSRDTVDGTEAASEAPVNSGVPVAHANEQLAAIPGLRLLGTAPHKAGVVSFVVDGAHAQDIALLIDQLGVAIRTGNHCAQPLLQHFGVTATCRASFAAYNTSEEIDIFVAALARAVEMVR